MDGGKDSCNSCRMSATQYHCPHCGALYEKTDTKAVDRDQDSVACVVCRNTMYEGSDTRVPSFKLIKRPESDTQ